MNLDRLEALEKAATAGPWTRIYGTVSFVEGKVTMCSPGRQDKEVAANSDFIAALRNAAPALIAEVRAARRWLAESDTPIASASADSDMWQFIQTRKAREAYKALVAANSGGEG